MKVCLHADIAVIYNLNGVSFIHRPSGLLIPRAVIRFLERERDATDRPRGVGEKRKREIKKNPHFRDGGRGRADARAPEILECHDCSVSVGNPGRNRVRPSPVRILDNLDQLSSTRDCARCVFNPLTRVFLFFFASQEPGELKLLKYSFTTSPRDTADSQCQLFNSAASFTFRKIQIAKTAQQPEQFSSAGKTTRLRQSVEDTRTRRILLKRKLGSKRLALCRLHASVKMQNNETRRMQKKKLEIRGSDSESGKEERRDGDVWRRGRTRTKKRGSERDGEGGGGASALGRELERWIFFMKEFERTNTERVPRLVLKP